MHCNIYIVADRFPPRGAITRTYVCNARSARSIGHELAPLATSSTNAFTRVYINVIAPVRTVSSHPSHLKRRYWVITSRTLTSRHLRGILPRRVYLLTLLSCRAINAHACTESAFSSHLSTSVPGNNNSNMDALSHAKC